MSEGRIDSSGGVVYFRQIALVCVPLLYLPLGADVRETPRAALVVLLAAAVLWAGTLDLRRWLAWPLVLALVLVPLLHGGSGLGVLLGAVPHAPGALLLLAYALLLLGYVSFAELRGLAVGCAVLTLAQALLVLAQVLSGSPATGTLGHPMFVGAWGALGASTGLALLMDRRKAALGRAALVAGWLILLLAARRGPLMMALIAATVMLSLVDSRQRSALRRLWFLLPVVLVAALIPLPELDGTSAFGRLFLAGADALRGLEARIELYRIAVDAIVQRPLLGWGLGAFADAAALALNESEAYVDARPHNAILAIAFALGVPAALAAGLLLSALTLRGFANARAATEDERVLVSFAAAIGPAYGCHLLFNVDQPGVGLWVMVLWSAAVGRQSAAPIGGALPRRVFAVAMAVFALLPLLASVALDVGHRRAREGDGAGAIATYRVAERTGATGCLATRLRATVARRQDVRSTASARIDALGRCLEDHPRDWLTRYQRALALEDAGELDDALAELSTLADALPRFEEIQVSYTRLLARAGESERALARLDPERASAEWSAVSWRLLGQIRESRGDREGALEAYRRARAWDGDDPVLRAHLRALRGTLNSSTIEEEQESGASE